MKATVYHGTRDVRLETVPDPSLREATDAIVRVTRAAICGSDLWFYRGVVEREPGERTGHEFVGIVEEVGSAVRNVKRGDAVIAPFAISDGTCAYCRRGLQTSCEHGSFWGDDANGAQAEYVRVPLADGTLAVMHEAMRDNDELLTDAATLCDVMATGHHGATTAGAGNGGTVVVVGDGAVGLCAVLSAARVHRASRVIAVGHNTERLKIAADFGASDCLDSHDPQTLERLLEITGGGAPSIVEAVGNEESFNLAIAAARPGGTVTYVGVPHNVKAPDLRSVFLKNISLRGGLAPARAYIESLMTACVAGQIHPGRVFDSRISLDRVAEGYAAMDERRAIKVLLNPGA
ncbi:MAG: alcohol dehydrogenase catalytic domain-containing protein [Candidatus Eremiobacteraeota bacterium]|uniref:Putative IMP dehydrogenase/GMP reductase domain n=1 Tax=mine drainage metagenome TaxID=410659 RepID=E6PEH4_9ZZZZ|nr:alcohol dehydrogenase catalytic domain-containing protein [Candidatus Eremiobacteraeota bacterium]